jgi:shikimate 5-dehydrogenase
MDSTLNSNIDSKFDSMLTYFVGTSYSLTSSTGTAVSIQPANILGYGGAAIALFLSFGGAFQAGSTIVAQTENSFFAFLETFQDNDKFGGESFLDDPDKD